jgi:hypothetical protein
VNFYRPIALACFGYRAIERLSVKK